ncbi:hypothetical protein AVEN_17587-1 [Araneus ventricosus]|uniref:Uncharacterized protein n=1 Tax=Araneus ventricosus TaxID=182803 RepID=A0A4Y2JYQ7_ARAVE|nr:hypothetical protein AVEN_17587-1 [Araneus ventricosus]
MNPVLFIREQFCHWRKSGHFEDPDTSPGVSLQSGLSGRMVTHQLSFNQSTVILICLEHQKQRFLWLRKLGKPLTLCYKLPVYNIIPPNKTVSSPRTTLVEKSYEQQQF